MSTPHEEPLPELPEDLRALVSGMQDDPLEEDRVARVRERLGPVLPPAGGAGPARSGLGAKLAAVGVIALIGLGGYLATRSSAPSAPLASAAGSSAVPSATDAGTVAASAPPDDPPAAAAVLADPVPSASAVTATPPPAAAKPGARAAADPDDVVAEEDILHRARAALATAPQQALDLTDAHAKKFPRGVLTQEREVVAIDALGRLGRSHEAADRAARFRARFPRSPYVQELKNRGLVE